METDDRPNTSHRFGFVRASTDMHRDGHNGHRHTDGYHTGSGGGGGGELALSALLASAFMPAEMLRPCDGLGLGLGPMFGCRPERAAWEHSQVVIRQHQASRTLHNV